MEGFEPYKQRQVLARLTAHLAPRGRLYLVAPAPFPRHRRALAVPGQPHVAELLLDTVNVRDTAILLAGEPPYREFPPAWCAALQPWLGVAVLLGRCSGQAEDSGRGGVD